MQEAMSEQITGELQALQTAAMRAARELALTSDRHASFENPMETMERSPKEQISGEEWIAGELLALQTAAEQTHGDVASDRGASSSRRTNGEDRAESLEEITKELITGQATLENRMGFIEKWSKELIGVELQAVRITRQQPDRDLVSANARQTIPEGRTESPEKLAKPQFAGELQAVQTTAEMAARDLASADDRRASRWERTETVEKPTKAHLGGELKALQTAMEQTAKGPVSEQVAVQYRPSSAENRMEAVQETMKEQITGGLQALQSAAKLATRELVLTSDRHASLEDRSGTMETSTNEFQTAVRGQLRQRADEPGLVASLAAAVSEASILSGGAAKEKHRPGFQRQLCPACHLRSLPCQQVLAVLRQAFSQQHAPVVDEVPATVTQDETVHVPSIGRREQPERHHGEHQTQVQDPMVREELVHVPKIAQPKRVALHPGELVVEAAGPQVREEIAQVPTVIQQPRHRYLEAEQGVEVPTPTSQDETVRVPTPTSGGSADPSPFLVREQIPDGNSLFRSFSDQVYGEPAHHCLMRSRCQKYIACERNYFQQFVAEPLEELLSRIGREGEWGADDVEIQALSEMYGCRVEIYVSHSPASHSLIRTFHETREAQLRQPVRLQYKGRAHYNSLAPRGGLVPIIETRPGRAEDAAFLRSFRRQAAGLTGIQETAQGVFDESVRLSRKEFEDKAGIEMDRLLEDSRGDWILAEAAAAMPPEHTEATPAPGPGDREARSAERFAPDGQT